MKEKKHSKTRDSGLGPKSLYLIEKAKEIINQYTFKLTLRQIYYRLVASQEIKNSRSSYNTLSRVLSQAREEGLIEPDAIEDRVRRLDGEIEVWDSSEEYLQAIKRWTIDIAENYTRDLWASQGVYCEVWTEKDALSSVLAQATSPYRIPIAVCRGYNSFTFLYDAVKRFQEKAKGRETVIFYYGDFDPSGEDMVRDIRERLSSYFNSWGNIASVPAIQKMALLREDIDAYDLPPDFTKKTDTRAKGFIKRYGDISVELDALPPDVLVQRVNDNISGLINDPEEWNQAIHREEQEKATVLASIKKVWGK